jgi:Ricin-type beta-trefoil lectin domain-like/CHAP domain
MKKNVILGTLFMSMIMSAPLSVYAQTAKAQEIVNIAQSQVGQNYQRYGGGTTPWCAIFVNWVYNQAGIPLEGGNAWVFSFLDAANRGKMGAVTTNPQPGDLVVYGNCTQNADCNHVAILVSKNADGSFVTIGGNENGIGSGAAHSQSSKVYRTNKAANTIVKAFIHPFALGTVTPATIANGTYNIRLANGKALDANNDQVNTNGGQIMIWDFHGRANQQWVLTAIGGGKYNIKVKSSGKSLDLNASNNVNDGKLTLWDFHGGMNQQWILASAGNGFYKIQSAFPPYRVVDVVGVAVNTNGANIHLWDFLNGVNQLWKIEPAK